MFTTVGMNWIFDSPSLSFVKPMAVSLFQFMNWWLKYFDLDF